MSAMPIYTVGYGNRSIGDFIDLLQKYGIKYLVDLRSQPYSRYSPTFSHDTLKLHLKQRQIIYLYMGDTLGGRPKDRGCYTDDDRVDYTILCTKDFYLRGIAHLYKAWEEKKKLIALMCSEKKPQECHRGKLIGNTLVEQGIEVAHIDESGNIKTQNQINHFFISGQTDGQPPLPLFNGDVSTTLNEKIGRSRKKYASNPHSADSTEIL